MSSVVSSSHGWDLKLIMTCISTNSSCTTFIKPVTAHVWESGGVDRLYESEGRKF